MRYFYSKDIDLENNTVSITGDELHHVVKVNRLSSGDECIVINGEGLRAHVKIDIVTKKEIICAIIDSEQCERPHARHITLCCGLSRKGAFSDVVEKAVELGVDTIVPFVSTRSMVKVKDDDKFIAKHTIIMREALTQCHRLFEPRIVVPITDVKSIEAFSVVGSKYLLDPTEGITPKELICQLAAEDTEEVIIAIGPEGGFTDYERKSFKGYGFQNVFFPNTVMRTGTASIAALALLRYGN